MSTAAQRQHARGPAVIGLDIGTGSSKAVLVDGAGAVLAAAAEPHPSVVPRDGWMEQDPDEWVASSLRALREVRDRCPEVHVEAIGLSGQMNGPVLLDALRAPLGNCLIWADERGLAECAEVTEAAPDPGLVPLTGKPAVPAYTAPKLLWLRRRDRRFRRARTMLLPKDYVRLRLGGAAVTDPTDASNTLLFDVRRREWCRPLLAALDLPEDLVPDVVGSADVTGGLTPEAAEATGLPRGLPLVAGGGDSVTAVLGAGVEQGDALVSLGSAGNVSATFDVPLIDPRCRVHTGCHSDEGRWIATAVQPTVGLALRWVASTLGESDQLTPLVREAAAAEAATVGLIFLPHLGGTRNPRYEPPGGGAFVGLSLSTTPSQLVRAVMEGVAFAQREAIDALQELGLTVHRLLIVGGGARGGLWPQILADVTGVPAVASQPGIDSSALGAAGLAAVAAGHSSSPAFPRAPGPTAPIQLEPTADGSAYDDGYALYQELCGAVATSRTRRATPWPAADGHPPRAA
jgi:xylulokinase